MRRIPFTLAILIFSWGLLGQSLDLKSFYQAMDTPGAKIPDSETVLAAMKQVQTMPADRIRDALPTIVTLLGSAQPQVAIWATFAVGVVGMRPDRDELLRPYMPALGTALTQTHDAHVQTGLLVTLGGLQPSSLTMTVPYLLRFFQAKSTETGTRIFVGSLLLKSENLPATALDVIVGLTQQTLATTEKVALIASLGVPGLKRPELLKYLFEGLGGTDPSVKLASIQAVRNLGTFPPEFTARLTSLTADTSEDLEVRKRADELLRGAPVGPIAVPALALPPGAQPMSEKFEPPQAPPRGR